MIKVSPYNNRLLIKEIKETEQKLGDIIVPNFIKEKKDIPKFMMVLILDASDNIAKDIVGKKAIIETGFLEEILIEGIMYNFCPYNYLVCIISE